MKQYKKELKTFSRNLRNNLTDAEQLLWFHLRRKQILNVQFYRQKPIAGYIVDFYCAAVNLVIELDGSQHKEAVHQENDEIRDGVLQSLDLLVLRFDNHQVIQDVHSVMNVIYEIVEARLNPP
jgi:very-short-patch-repair endonuclease